MTAPAPQPEPARDREYWRAPKPSAAAPTGHPSCASASSVLAWVRAGRPPLSKWHAGNASEDGS